MSTLNVSNITDGTTTVGTSYVVNGSAKATASFSQSANIIRDSLNTSSLTDTSTGKGDLNWISAMSGAGYASLGTSNAVSSGTPYAVTLIDASSGSLRTPSKWYYQSVYSNNSSSSFHDPSYGSVAIHGDLA